MRNSFGSTSVARLPRKIRGAVSNRVNHFTRRLANLFVPRWAQSRQFQPEWKVRIQRMSEFIEPGQTVLDLGCGMQWLRGMLPPGCIYIPCDLFRRDEQTLVCDFNAGEFPEVRTDVAFISGTLEYLHDWQGFLKKAYAVSQTLIFSYCLEEDYPDKIERFEKHQWVNTLTQEDLRTFLESLNPADIQIERRHDNGTIFVAMRAAVSS